MAIRMNKLDERGKYQVVNIADLKVDALTTQNPEGYQRGVESNVERIAREFTWTRFGAITVMRRDGPNGGLYVIEGQQRLSAAKLRGDITRVPCVIFQSTGRQHEAVEFLRINLDRKMVSAIHKFKASVVAQINPEAEIDAWMKANGFSVAATPGRKDVVTFPHRFIITWKQDEDSAKIALELARDLTCDGDGLNNYVHGGLWWILHSKEHYDKLTAKAVEQLRKAGGSIAILQRTRAMQIEMSVSNSGGPNLNFTRVPGLAILDMLKHCKRQQRREAK